MEEEVWVPIPRFNGDYLVSNLGRIKGVAGRSVTYFRFGRINTRTFPERIIKPQSLYKGYQAVDIGGVANLSVHQLVAEAFLGPRPENYDVDHKDNDPSNNRASNLEWVTRGENIRRGYERGSRKPVTGHPRGSDGRFLTGSFR